MSENTQEKRQAVGLENLSIRMFLGSIAVIALLMVVAYVLTLIIPSGEFTRIVDASGNTVIDNSTPFTYVEGGIPFWKWLLSPILVLTAQGGALLIAVVLFLMIIGGIFRALEVSGIMNYLMEKLIHLFARQKYRLMAVLILFFMLLSSFVGCFEEIIPLVPIVTSLAVGLGWDLLTGLGMCLLAAGCGFSAGICNPFSVGVAQTLAGLPMFSGVSLRILSFILIYVLLLSFVRHHAKKVDTKPEGRQTEPDSFTGNKSLDSASLFFGLSLAVGIVLVLCSGFVPALRDYSLIVMALAFLIGGIGACRRAGLTGKAFGVLFCKGVIAILPAAVMILMASSIRYTLEEAKVLDTILYMAVGIAGNLPGWAVVLFIYLIVLVMNFFVSSGSAKAFMLIPIIVPLAQIFGVSSQLCIVAFAFGDGFSNVFYPTNAGLLVGLGLSGVSYDKWFRYSAPFQLANLLLTSAILLFGYVVGY